MSQGQTYNHTLILRSFECKCSDEEGFSHTVQLLKTMDDEKQR